MTSLPKVLAQLKSPSSMLQVWGLLKSIPGGGTVMGRLVGRMAPYTGTIRPQVEQLEIGYAKVSMRDRKKVRNHLKSVHAIALMNLGEMTTGVAMMVSMPTVPVTMRLAVDFAMGTKSRACSGGDATPSFDAALLDDRLE